VKRIEITKREQYVVMTCLRATLDLLRNDAGHGNGGPAAAVRRALDDQPRTGGPEFGPPAVVEIDSLLERIGEFE